MHKMLHLPMGHHDLDLNDLRMVARTVSLHLNINNKYRHPELRISSDFINSSHAKTHNGLILVDTIPLVYAEVLTILTGQGLADAPVVMLTPSPSRTDVLNVDVFTLVSIAYH